MKRQRKKQMVRLTGRLLAVTAAVALLAAAPVDWTRLGQTTSLAAVCLQQPDRLAAWLCGQTEEKSPASQTVTDPVGNAAPPARPDGTEPMPDIPVSGTPQPQTPPITMMTPPAQKGDSGQITEIKMDTGNRLQTGIATLNRSGTSVDVAAALKKPLTLSLTKTTEPQVLILHTHTTEGYMTYDSGYYNSEDRHRTQDHTKNVCAAGEAIRLALEAYGIVAIHDTTVHDSPVYSGAYNRSAATAQTYLDRYPSIRVVLDIHRDAVMQGDTTLVKPTAVVNGKKAAQMMLITGVVSTTALPHPGWEENLIFSTHLQQALDGASRDLMRPLNTVASRYNQHLSPGWVLVEVGSEGNTVEEAVYAGQILGQTLADLLT